MTTTGARKVGEFCWINVLTPDPDRAREFFASLLGWTFIEIPGMGHRAQVGGKDIGGVFDHAGPGTPPGTPAGIGVMVRVANADEMVAKVNALGGKAQAAFDIGPQGRMADCHDPLGANIDIWEPKASGGMEADSRQHGAPSWFENMTTDAARATKYYTELFGWTAKVSPMQGGEYTEFQLGDDMIGGMMQITPDMGPIPPHWGVYFTVNDADKAAAEATRLGGSLFVPPVDIPNVGRFCGILSPQGVRFYALQYSR